MLGFFQEYLIDPIIYGSGYNPYNTIILGIGFVLLVFGIYKFLEKYSINIDKQFFISVLPFMVLGALLRVFEDTAEYYNWYQGMEFPLFFVNPVTGITKNAWFITPLVYLITFAIALVSLYIFLKKTQDYHRPWFLTGAVLCLIVAGPLLFNIVNSWGGALIIGIVFLFVAGVYVFSRFVKNISFENMAVFLSHVFDATTTFVSIQFFGYGEKHVLAKYFISLFGPAGMYIMKLPVLALVLYIIDKDLQNVNQKNFLKLMILAIGLGPGLRNMIRLVLGV